VIRDHLISVIHLRELFRAGNNGGGKKYAIILGIGSRRVGLLVDRLMGQQELVIKAVDSRYTQTGLVSGASILGNGRVVLILDAPAIFNKAVEEEKLRAARS
jgi:two-component system chemotaxis sensor kinase CheA